MTWFTNWLNDTRKLQRAVWVTLAGVIGILLAFAGYYYWDRYVYLGDQAPLALGAAELERQVRANPSDPNARLALAETYLRSQRYEETLEQAAQVREAFPSNDRAGLITGLAYAFMGKSAAAVPELEQFAAIHRHLPTAPSDMALQVALYYLGDNYLKLERPAEAIPVLEEALAISPTDADSLFLLGLAYLRAGQPQPALENFNRATRFVPDFAEAYAGMEECYQALGMDDYSYYARGMQAFARKNYRAAESQLRIAVERLPDYAPAFTGLGLSQEQLGNYQTAKSSLERAVLLDSEDFVASNALQRVQLALSQ